MQPMTQETAEVIALQALGWIVNDQEIFDAFLGATGTSADDMRNRVNDSEFLISVLDFLMMDDAWITGFCTSAGHPYERPFEARQSLPGGAQVHWT